MKKYRVDENQAVINVQPTYLQERRSTPVERRRKRHEMKLPRVIELDSDEVTRSLHMAQRSKQILSRYRAQTEETSPSRFSQRQSPYKMSTLTPEQKMRNAIEGNNVNVYKHDLLFEWSTEQSQRLKSDPSPSKATYKEVLSLENKFNQLNYKIKKIRPLLFPVSRKQVGRYQQQYRQTYKLIQQCHNLIE